MGQAVEWKVQQSLMRFGSFCYTVDLGAEGNPLVINNGSTYWIKMDHRNNAIIFLPWTWGKEIVIFGRTAMLNVLNISLFAQCQLPVNLISSFAASSVWMEGTQHCSSYSFAKYVKWYWLIAWSIKCSKQEMWSTVTIQDTDMCTASQVLSSPQ